MLFLLFHLLSILLTLLKFPLLYLIINSRLKFENLPLTLPNVENLTTVIMSPQSCIYLQNCNLFFFLYIVHIAAPCVSTDTHFINAKPKADMKTSKTSNPLAAVHASASQNVKLSICSHNIMPTKMNLDSLFLHTLPYHHRFHSPAAARSPPTHETPPR